MNNLEKEIENFKIKMDNLMESNYLLADNKVGDVLRSIAYSELLFNLFVFLQNVEKLNIYVSFICFFKNTFQFDDDDKV